MENISTSRFLLQDEKSSLFTQTFNKDVTFSNRQKEIFRDFFLNKRNGKDYLRFIQVLIYKALIKDQREREKKEWSPYFLLARFQLGRCCKENKSSLVRYDNR